jgi:hypothetical protein
VSSINVCFISDHYTHLGNSYSCVFLCVSSNFKELDLICFLFGPSIQMGLVALVLMFLESFLCSKVFGM